MSARWLMSFVSLFYVFAVATAEGNQPNMAGQAEGQGLRFGILHDTAAVLTIGQVAQLAPELFDTKEAYDVASGFVDHAVWIRLDVHNAHAQQEVLVELAYPLIDQIRFYQRQDSAENWTVTETGDGFPFQNRPVQARNFAFPVVLDQGANLFFLRIESESSITLPFKLWTPEGFESHRQKSGLAHGFYYGAALVMILFNLFIFLSLRNVSYLYYAFSSFFIAASFLYHSGLGFQFFWPESIRWNQQSFNLIVGLSTVFSALFAIHFLRLRVYSRVLFLSLSGFAVAGGLLAILWSMFSYRQLIPWSMIMTAMLYILFIVSGLVVLRKGYRPARFFLVAWSAFIVSTLVSVLRGTGWLSLDFLLLHEAQIGSLLEITLLSVALADRINLMKSELAQKELEKAQIKNQVVEEERARLEDEVQKRTEELRSLNATRDKFFAIISHDLKSALMSFKGIGQVIRHHLQRSRMERVHAIVENLDDRAGKLDNLLNNLLNWAISQTGEIPFKPENLLVSEVIDETTELFAEIAAAKGISINSEVEDQLILWADRDGLSLICRNLLGNAIKFTPSGGAIHISVEQEQSKVLLRISDSGIGMDEEQQQKLFNPGEYRSRKGTNDEEGSGLGLAITREFVLLHRGEISVTSQKGVGTTFVVRFPIKNMSNGKTDIHVQHQDSLH